MPLFIGDVCYSPNSHLSSVVDAILNHSTYKDSSSSLCCQPCQEVSSKGLLYVSQREYAVVHPNDEFIKVIGSDDATTCHIVVMRHTGSGVVALSHCDGVGLEEGLEGMIRTIKSKSGEHNDGKTELHILGGFVDEREESIKVTRDLLKYFIENDEDLYLKSACILCLNNTVVEEVNYPIIYGVGVDVKTGDIFRAKFSERGPVIDVRGATHFIGYDKMSNIYEAGKGIVKIGPFSWSPWKDMKDWLEVPDFFIRKYMSTSSEQEPEHFEDSVRAALRVIYDHPNPSETLFHGGKPLTFKLQPDGKWVRLSS